MPGRMWEYRGERFYSPNSARNPGPPPQEEHSVMFTPGVSSASNFQNPRWWNARTEWLAFVPRQPVPHAGVWFDSLSTLPKHVYQTTPEGFKLHGQLLEVWNVLDRLLCDTTKHLGEKNNLIYLRPFPPYGWRYNKSHATEGIALEHVKESRDWFAMWIGLLYWMTRKTSQGVDGITPPTWYIQAVEKLRKQREIDILRCTPLLHSFWDIDRVGIFLHNPDDRRDQPSVNWFIEQNIPVWYRWSSREEREWNPSLIRPSDDNVGACDHEADVLSQVEKEAGRVEIMTKVFNNFTEKREAQNQKIVLRETTEARAKRLQRENQPPTRKATVYVWEWGASDVFGPRAVPVEDRVDTLLEYSHYGARFYNAFHNEWNCWPPLTSTDHQPEDIFHEDVLISGPPSPRPITIASPTTMGPSSPQSTPATSTSCSSHRATVVQPSSPALSSRESQPLTMAKENTTWLKPFNHIKHGEEFDAERIHYHVLEILSAYFGFVAPIPHPTSYSEFVAANDYKSVSAVLGLPNSTHDNLFFKTPLGKICTRFVCSFTGQLEPAKPSSELWDLSADNWRTIKFSNRLSSIRKVGDNKCTMFMFDLAGSATVPWMIAVYSAPAALFVCRLDEKFHEEAVVMELVSSGIPFRTLQRKDTLQSAPVDRTLPSLIPWRMNDHIFDSTDWEFYQKQCRIVMSLRRARAALLRGGFVWRVGLHYMDRSEAARGPWGIHVDASHMFTVKDSSRIKYVDDELTQDEFDTLCGIYRSYTGFKGQVAQLSWFPSLSMFEGSGLNIHNREGGLPNFNLPLSATKWRDKVRGYADARRANKQLEKWSREFIEDHVGHL
ncbi:hypothetical protein AN958_05273 [Leucoagaricus sp. SymC.cos]|nr:hypothetical protein AN958_05273 [Leucoagaricus sp. SymC.cos]